ncbi:MAG: tetratricopeptide repeat protein, partial [Anaerolineae bacterium]
EPERGILPLANFYSRRAGDLKTARDVLRKALLTYPDSRFRLSWMRRQGEILVELGEWGEAQQVYTELAAQFPDDISSLIGLGWLIYERGDGLDAAVTVFEQAIERDPERGEGYFAMGQILAQAGRYAEADSWLRLAIEREPQNLYWWLERANTARDAGNLALALEIYGETLSRFPEHAGTYYHMAWAYRLDEQPEQAILAIERALALKDPSDSKFYGRAGEIYEWRGDLEKARVAYERALTLDPGNDTAAAGLRRIEEE